MGAVKANNNKDTYKALLGSLSGYLLPLALLIIGIILFWVSKR